MKIRVHADQRTTPATPPEEFLITLQNLRKSLAHDSTPRLKTIFEQIEKLERDFVVLCDDLEPITRGDKSILMRALRMYMKTYQEMKGKEKDPLHKGDLQNYITAAENLFNKLFGAWVGKELRSEKDR